MEARLTDAQRFLAERRFVEAGVWVRPFGRIVYLTPAFTIGEDELARLTGAVASVLSAAARR